MNRKSRILFFLKDHGYEHSLVNANGRLPILLFDGPINVTSKSGSLEIEATMEKVLAQAFREPEFGSVVLDEVIYVENSQPQSQLVLVKAEVKPKSELRAGWAFWPKERVLGADFEGQNEVDILKSDFVIQREDGKQLRCVDCIIVVESKGRERILMMEKRTPSGNIVWEYPKGGIRFLESVREGAEREVLEETGLRELRFSGLLGSQLVDVSDRGAKYEFLDVYGVVFRGEFAKLEVAPETQEGFTGSFEWLGIEDAKERIWMREYGVEFLSRYQRGELSSSH